MNNPFKKEVIASHGIIEEYNIFIQPIILSNMALGLRVLFYPKTNEYEVVSPEGFTLRMTENDFKAIKCKMNGIAISLAEQAREKKKEAKLAAQNLEGTISSSVCAPPSLSEDPIV